MDVDVDIDVLDDRLISLTLRSLMQTKLLQFHSFINLDIILYKFLTVGSGDGAMGRGMPCQGHRAMV